jgi:hypothetical protein
MGNVFQKQFNENIFLNVSYTFQSLIGPIKFSVTFLMGPPNCTSTHVLDLKVEVYIIKDVIAYKR